MVNSRDEPKGQFSKPFIRKTLKKTVFWRTLPLLPLSRNAGSHIPFLGPPLFVCQLRKRVNAVWYITLSGTCELLFQHTSTRAVSKMRYQVNERSEKASSHCVTSRQLISWLALVLPSSSTAFKAFNTLFLYSVKSTPRHCSGAILSMYLVTELSNGSRLGSLQPPLSELSITACFIGTAHLAFTSPVKFESVGKKTLILEDYSRQSTSVNGFSYKWRRVCSQGMGLYQHTNKQAECIDTCGHNWQKLGKQ